MKKQLFTILLTCLLGCAFAQPVPCIPMPGSTGETCLNPCWTCLNPYFGNTFNFQPMGAAIDNFCPPTTNLHNDQYLAFKVLCGGTGAVTFTITPNGGCGIQAAIYKVGGCGALPLACNRDFSNTLSNFGNNVNYTAGDFYMLMIDGLAGAQCFFTVTINQPSCVENPPNPFSQNWGPITSNAPIPIPCPNPAPDIWWNLNVPVVAGANSYQWYVKSGPAILRKTPPLQTGTSITVNGAAGAAIQFNPNGTGTIEICCKAGIGCAYTNEVCKTFEVVMQPNRDTSVHICSEDTTWAGTGVPNAQSPLPGAPFPPGTYALNVKTAQNCPYVLNLVVIKDPPLIKDLGNQLLCATETFTYCGQSYSALQGGPKTFICNGTGSAYPANCDTNITVNIIPVSINIILTSNGATLACPGDKRTLTACTSSFAPSGGTVTYKWFRNDTIIPGATNCSYDASKAGVYRLDMTVSYGNKSCTSSKELTVVSSYPTLPVVAVVPQTGPFCEQQSKTFTISNPDPNFLYTWTLNGISVGTGNMVTVNVPTPTMNLCVKTVNICAQDTTKCYSYAVLNNSFSERTATACVTYLWNGIKYDTSGTYTQTIKNSVGCDSIMKLNLTILKPSSSTVNLTVCDSVIFNKILYKKSGTYLSKIQNSLGCDSTITLNLTVNRPTTSTVSISGCDFVTYNNLTYTTTGTYTTKKQNAVGCDSLITLIVTINRSTSTLINAIGCRSYKLNNQEYDSTGVYIQKFSTSEGCDSIVRLNLIIIKLDTLVSVQKDLLSADANNATYQWYDCDSKAIVVGATSKDFSPKKSGNYAVILKQGDCIDTSGCYKIVLTGQKELQLSDKIKVFPNPTSGMVRLTYDEGFQNATVRILNVQGQILGEFAPQSGQNITVDLHQLTSGLYLLQIQDAKGLFLVSVVKE